MDQRISSAWNGVLLLLETLLLLGYYLSTRPRPSAIAWWTGAFASLMAGSILVALRHLIPDVLSIVVGNTADFLFGPLLLAGIASFKGKPFRWRLHILFALATLAWFTWFGLIRPHMLPRIYYNTLAWAVYAAWGSAELLRNSGKRLPRFSRLAGGILALGAFLLLLRAGLTMKFGVPEDYTQITIRDTALTSLMAILMFVAGMAFIFMVTARLGVAAAESELKFRAMFESIRDGVSVSMRGRRIFVNPAWVRMFGYASPEEAIGQPVLDNVAASHRGQVEDFIRRRAADESVPHFYESRFLRSDGSEFDVDLGVSSYQLDGESYSVAMIRDITERKRGEASLRAMYSEKEALLGELQHRVKNSLNMISSMIGMAEGRSATGETREALGDLGLRVRSISELYSLLYGSGNFREVQLDEYCARIAGAIVGLHGEIGLSLDLESLTIPAKQAAPIGLLLTELVTNALKYAFTGGAGGNIGLLLRRTGSLVRLVVSDDGRGLPPGFDEAASSGMGLWLVRGMVQQIGGSFTMTSDGGGTRCELALPLLQEA